MLLGTDRALGQHRLSPAVPQRVRVVSFCAAVALHGLAVAMALLYKPAPAEVSTPAIEVALIVEQAGPAAAEPAEAADPVETIEAIEAVADPLPAPPEPVEQPPIVAEAPAPQPDVEPPVEPAPVQALTPPPAIAATPLPPAPRPRPLPPTAAGPSTPTPQSPETPRAPAQPEAVAVVPAPRAAVGHVEADYIAALLGWLERYKEYPRAARLRRIEGTAMVRLAILADGSLGALSLARSSGHAMLDDAAIDMVRRASPFPRPPHAPCELDVPVVFAQSRP